MVIALLFSGLTMHRHRPTRFIAIASTSVKLKTLIDREHCFQLVFLATCQCSVTLSPSKRDQGTPSRIYFLSADDARTRMEWVSAIRRSIYLLLDQQKAPYPTSSALSSVEPPSPRSVRNQSPRVGAFTFAVGLLSGSSTGHKQAAAVTVKDILSVPANRVCAECDAEPVAWVSAKLYILLCDECKDIHGEVFSQRDLIAIHKIKEREKRLTDSENKESPRSTKLGNSSDELSPVVCRPTCSGLACAHTCRAARAGHRGAAEANGQPKGK